jgi:hypothetical protein
MVTAPGEYAWSAHRHIAAENGAEVRLHELYMKLGADPASRYAAYLDVLREEMKRQPHSLATALFVGTGDFVGRMQRRFDIGRGQLPKVEQVALIGGIRCLELRRSRKRRSDSPQSDNTAKDNAL